MIILALKEQSIEELCQEHIRTGVFTRILQQQISSEGEKVFVSIFAEISFAKVRVLCKMLGMLSALHCW